MRKLDPLSIKTENTVRLDLQSSANNDNTQHKIIVVSALTKKLKNYFVTVMYFMMTQKDQKDVYMKAW